MEAINNVLFSQLLDGNNVACTDILRTGMTSNMNYGNFGWRKLLFLFMQNYSNTRLATVNHRHPFSDFPEGKGGGGGGLYTG